MRETKILTSGKATIEAFRASIEEELTKTVADKDTVELPVIDNSGTIEYSQLPRVKERERLRALEVLWSSKEELIEVFTIIAEVCYDIVASKGFHDQKVPFPEFIALLHSEVTEMFEAYRHHNPPSEHVPSISAINEEMADLFIRMMDRIYLETTITDGVFSPRDFIDSVINKLCYNAQRPTMHGNKKC